MYKVFNILIVYSVTCMDINICNSMECNNKLNNINISHHNNSLQYNTNNININENLLNKKRLHGSLINKKLIKTNTGNPNAYILEQYFNKNYYNNEIRRVANYIKNYDSSYKDFVNDVLKIFEVFQFNLSFDINRQCIYSVLRNIPIDLANIKCIAEMFDDFKFDSAAISNMLTNNNQYDLQLYINKNNLPNISLSQLYYYIVNQSRKLCAQTMHALFKSISNSNNTNNKLEIVYDSFNVLQRVIDKLHTILDNQFSADNNNKEDLNNSIEEEKSKEYELLYETLINSLEHCQEEVILKSNEFNPQFITIFNNTHNNIIENLNKIHGDISISNNIIYKINNIKSQIDNKIKYQINKFHKINIKNTIHKYITDLQNNILNDKSINNNYKETFEWKTILKILDDLLKNYQKEATIRF